ncbi:MAG: DNA (cytosine-5-)-methyltransferase [Deltaproteobacteria bacterium]|nr:DNA (cytosine-5-)-methyltransferase [Deltaproteobacteria bacterium]
MEGFNLQTNLAVDTRTERVSSKKYAAAEFFAGVGLVRLGLEQADIDVVFATDIDNTKFKSYAANFGSEDFHLADVRNISGADIPNIQVATASFPCTDLSLAGKRAGLKGEHSGMFWEFARVIDEMGSRKPSTLLLENVPGFASSREGKDLHDAIERLNGLGYSCDLLVVDAKHFVPQSRQRLFIVASQVKPSSIGDWEPSNVRPAWIKEFVNRFPQLDMAPAKLSPLQQADVSFDDVAERLSHNNKAWWNEERLTKFVESLSPLHKTRLEQKIKASQLSWATAYRRTRNGNAIWEIRPDNIAGCLRTPRGGSSKQAVVEAGRGKVRVRWMTAKEYASLQGAPDFKLHAVTETQAKFAMGDAVCVPAISWIMREYTSLVELEK